MKHIILSLLFFIGVASAAQAHNVTHYVNPMVGTDFTGNTYPGVQCPFGMVQLSPDNLIGGWDRISGYFYPDSTITGFSHTHLDGTGAGDMYDISFFPVTLPYKADFRKPGKDDPNPDAAPLGIYSTFSHDEEHASAGYYNVRLKDYDIDVTLTCTPRCGVQRYIFPNNEKERVVILNLERTMNWDATEDCMLEQLDARNFRGYRFSNGWAQHQKVYFATRFSIAPERVEIDSTKTASGGKGIVAKFYFPVTLSPNDADREIVICTALSGTSIYGATKNLEAEAPHDYFAEYLQLARNEWNTHLSVIEIGDSAEPIDIVLSTDNKKKNDSIKTMDKEEYEENCRKFYTALYHSMLAPTIYSDVDGKYLGPDKRIHTAQGVHYSTFSLWDTYRAAHPLFTLTNPDRVGDMVESLIEFGEQNGRLPVWSMWAGETDMMIGYHSVPVIADALFKGFKGFDPERALNISVKTARNRDYRSLGTYMDKGYVPTGVNDMGGNDDWSLSRTLEYAYDDWCIYAMANALGEHKIAKEFKARSQNYENVFNIDDGFMEPRNADGTFVANFNPDEYGPHICESNGWMYLWNVQHNMKGLCNLLGGKKKMAKKLNEFFTHTEAGTADRPLFSTGMIGQYAHGNEPSHHAAYLFNFVNQPSQCQKYVSQICHELYKDAPDGLCGNEDCGQTSAWFVFSAMGFYPVNPVGGVYELGTPLLPKMQINLENGKTFTIIAPGVDKDHFYVKKVKINGMDYPYHFINEDVIQSGCILEFVMSDKPCKSWWKKRAKF